MRGEIDLPVPIPLERWDVDYGTGASTEVIQSNMLRFAALADGVDCFDAGAFRTGPAEAAAMDPQQRVLLEQAYAALQVRTHTRMTVQEPTRFYLTLVEWYSMIDAQISRSHVSHFSARAPLATSSRCLSCRDVKHTIWDVLRCRMERRIWWAARRRRRECMWGACGRSTRSC